MDPLSITTGIITLYSVVWQLKSLRDSYREAPETIKALARDCDDTLNVILHTIWRLDSYEPDPDPDKTFNPVDIRYRLREHIATLYPEVKALREKLAAIQREPETNWDHLAAHVLKRPRLSHLEGVHRRIAERLVQLDRLLRSVDG